MKTEKLYIAAPYTKLSPEQRKEIVELVTKLAAKLSSEDQLVYSPLTYGVALAPYLSEEQLNSHEFWMRQTACHIRKGWVLVVVMYPGFDESDGLAAELRRASTKGCLSVYLYPKDVQSILVGTHTFSFFRDKYL